MRVGVGILGGGTVGGTLARKLLDDHEVIASKSGVELALVKVAVRDMAKPRAFPAEYATDDLESVVDDPSVKLVVELMGGLEPARSLVLRALAQGKAVVTANKELVAADGPELFQEAASHGVSLLFEAAVGGGIPLIRPLSESLAGERLTRVLGIVNGTTNFILSAMDSEGRDYADVLEEAQRLGYAEADPTADVGGGDAAAKAAILAALAFGVWVGGDGVYREGITEIQTDDIEFGRRLGYCIKLLAVGEDTPAGVAVRVHPAMVPLDHPLASVRGAHNAVFVEGPAVGDLLFMGPGAGGDPTATAVLGDVIDAARELLAGTQVVPRIQFGAGRLAEFEQVLSQFYIRLEVADAPGVLAQIAGVFGDHGVSIRSVWQEGRGGAATLLLVTHEATEGDQQAALDAIRSLDTVRQVAAAIRVIGS
ncbi:MAG: homoserine dehydrogenase [Acidimicrobiia bacterium]|nr:homoserine dehydrogenase [Acidimicrobiia bacterium]MDH4308018.1 homoserine dehydrogenase [Acidimicrobiia bacterium]MDH5292291.1 homoserine dehydrogenase [Acidimicrobiia bacterium]